MTQEKFKSMKEWKLWFINIVLILMWGVIVFIDVFPDIELDNEILKTSLYAFTAIIPMYLMYEGMGIWKSIGVEVKDPTINIEKKDNPL